jgi:hypothetical protein
MLIIESTMFLFFDMAASLMTHALWLLTLSRGEPGVVTG